MKSVWWALLFLLIIAVCATAMLFISGREQSGVVGIYENGELVRKINLDTCGEMEFSVCEGRNTVRVSNGSVYVSEATCRDKVCVIHGELRGGRPIVCLPHRLVTKFLYGDTGGYDAISG